jgi:zinc and cadmium transporter
VGLTLHSVVDGVALAAAVQAQALGHGMAGFAVFLVVLLHKPFDSMTLVTLMGLGGWSRVWRHVVNGLFALSIVFGAAAFHLGAGWLSTDGNGFVAAAVAFSAGTFLCIALSDLLPELQFHRHDRLKLSAALFLGVALAWTVSFFEAEAHDHDHEGGASPGHQQHDDHGSDPHDDHADHAHE